MSGQAAVEQQQPLGTSYPVPASNRFPLSRFAARVMDVTLFAVVAGSVLGMLGLSDDNITLVALVVLAVGYPIAEGLVTFRFKTTPGKALMRVRLIEKQDRLTTGDYNARAFSAHFKGFAAGIPLLSFITALLGWRSFAKNGRTAWDDESSIYAFPLGAGIVRWLAFVGLMLLASLLATINETMAV